MLIRISKVKDSHNPLGHHSWVCILETHSSDRWWKTVVLSTDHGLYWVCLGFYSFMPHGNKSLWSVPFCVLFLGFIHIVTIAGVPFLPFWNVLMECLALNGLLGCFCSLKTVLEFQGPWVLMSLCMCIPFSPVVHPRQWLLLVWYLYLFIYFSEFLCCFLKHLHQLCFPTIRHRGSCSSTFAALPLCADPGQVAT